MATFKNIALFVLLFYCGTACNIPEPRITVTSENIIRPEPIQSQQPADTAFTPITPETGGQTFNDEPPGEQMAQDTPRRDNKRPEKRIVQEPGTSIRDKSRQIYRSQIGVREATGKNDGRAVEMYLKATGLGKGFSWCAAFVRWTFDSAGQKTSITAWSPTAHNPKNIVFFQRRAIKEPAAADVFTIWYSAKRRIAHTGFIDRKINGSVVQTVEGNTNDAGSREGDGVYSKKRSINSLYSITRWLPD